jgi:enoyl-CoA hydratase
VIDVTHKGHVVIFQMSHGKANALDVEFCENITRRLEEIRTSSARAVVLTGQNRIFSAGVDLLRALDGGPEYLRIFLPTLSRTFETLFFYPKPVVAAINGHAIAGGCVLACAADKRVMARDSGRVGVPELLVGVPFPALALEIMRFASASQHFQEIIYGGATFSPEDAAARGLVDEIVEPQDLMDRAVAAAESFAALPPLVFTLTKRQIRQPVLESRQKEGPNFDSAVHNIWLAPEALTTMRNYVSRTFKKS